MKSFILFLIHGILKNGPLEIQIAHGLVDDLVLES